MAWKFNKGYFNEFADGGGGKNFNFVKHHIWTIPMVKLNDLAEQLTHFFANGEVVMTTRGNAQPTGIWGC